MVTTAQPTKVHAKHDPMVPRPYRIQRVRQETADTFTMELEPTDGLDIPAFLPGQFNMLYVFGVGEVPISICGDPSRRSPLLHTTRAVGTVTRAMAALKKGDVIGVRGPFGSAWPVDKITGKDVVIVAGGIGLPPLRPAIYHIQKHRKQYGKVAVLYGARTPEDLLFTEELEQWRAKYDFEVAVTVDRATGAWQGTVGVVTRLIPRASFDPANAVAMMVGPEIMMRFTTVELQKRGLKNDQIYLSMERNMKCAVGFCGHCQYGPKFICKDGPVFSYSTIEGLIAKWEI